MRVAVLSANLGDVDVALPWAPQAMRGSEIDVFRYDDKNMPPRSRALAPRLQAKIPKCFGWDVAPGYTVYVWVDAAFVLGRIDSVAWLLDQMYPAEFISFLHPERNTIVEEAEYLRANASKRYIRRRYEGEWLDELVMSFSPDYPDTRLLATGVFAYVDTPAVRDAMTHWWVMQSRYHINDQLSLPYALWSSMVACTAVPGNIFDNEYFVHTRNRKWRATHA